MPTDPLRLALLEWVQDHRIERYCDGSLVSHNEAVEELVYVFDHWDEEPVYAEVVNVTLWSRLMEWLGFK